MGLVKPMRSCFNRLLPPPTRQLPWSQGGMSVGSQTLRLANYTMEVFPQLPGFKIPLFAMKRNFSILSFILSASCTIITAQLFGDSVINLS